MLELGAGTGRVALALAELGVQVTGVEPSAAMLERARERAQGSPAGNNITWHQMDAASFTLDQRFRLAIIPFGGFTHLLTQGEQLSALRQVAAHLEPGGGLAVDVGNPIGALRGDDLPVLAYERTFPDPQTGQPVMQQWLKTIDRATQVEEITWVYDRVAPGGEVFRSVVPMKMRHTPAPEMRLLLALGGFRDVEFYGDYDFNPYSEESPRLFTVAARGEADL